MVMMSDSMMVSIAITLAVLFIWLFMGVYREREYFTHHLFLKHRPSIKFFFIPDDTPPDERNDKQKRQAHLYRLFVEEKNGYARSLFIGF